MAAWGSGRDWGVVNLTIVQSVSSSGDPSSSGGSLFAIWPSIPPPPPFSIRKWVSVIWAYYVHCNTELSTSTRRVPQWQDPRKRLDPRLGEKNNNTHITSGGASLSKGRCSELNPLTFVWLVRWGESKDSPTPVYATLMQATLRRRAAVKENEGEDKSQEPNNQKCIQTR